MSAPIVACGIADAIGALLPMLNQSLGCHCTVEYHDHKIGEREGWFTIYLHDHGRAFQGSGETLSRAVMNANSARQTHEENLEKAA